MYKKYCVSIYEIGKVVNSDGYDGEIYSRWNKTRPWLVFFIVGDTEHTFLLIQLKRFHDNEEVLIISKVV